METEEEEGRQIPYFHEDMGLHTPSVPHQSMGEVRPQPDPAMGDIGENSG